MGKKRILIADDDPDVLEVIKAILEHEGFRVRSARDGEQALKLVRKNDFDAVILDVDMPKRSGVRVLQRMRKQPDLKDVPVMLITGNLLKAKELQENGVAKLANDYLIKPFNTREFMKRVRALLDPASPESKATTVENRSQISRI
jgi:DNA-binding response OmpR family regulator